MLCALGVILPVNEVLGHRTKALLSSWGPNSSIKKESDPEKENVPCEKKENFL